MTTVAASSELIRVGTLEELAQKKQIVVRGSDRPIVVFHNDGDVRAVDNRCPHMGFPLHKGTCEHGMITCHWHHARFDAASGCTFDLFADDVPAYDTVVRDGVVFVAPRPRHRDPVEHGLQRLREGMQQNIGLIQAKAILTLRGAGVAPVDIVREAALFGLRNRDGWGGGLNVLACVTNLLPYLSEQTAALALYHGVRFTANDVAGQAPRRPRQPLETDELSLDKLDRLLRYWTTVRHRDGAERTILTAIERNNASMTELTKLMFAAATERFYSNIGHVADFSNKAFELLAQIGPEHAADVLPSVLNNLITSRGGEELNAWRHPVDLVPLIRDATDRLDALFAAGRGKRWQDETALANQILRDDPTAILAAITGAIESGATPAQLSKSLAYAAAMRVARFGTSNEIGDWFTALHTFSYCNGLHQAITRCPDVLLVRGVLHGAMSVYLDRFLNVPPAKLPGERKTLDDLPTAGPELLGSFLDALDNQHQVDRAARVVARYLEQGHPTEALIDTMTYGLLREDFDFHTLQMLEAAVQQLKEWPPGSPQQSHLLIATARYLAAFSPTQRAQLQTAKIALRLHRGEDIYEEDDAGN